MNKILKAKKLPLFSILDLNELRRENHLEGATLTDFSIAWDRNVYLLMEQPSETQGKDWISTPSTYTAVERSEEHTSELQHITRSRMPSSA